MEDELFGRKTLNTEKNALESWVESPNYHCSGHFFLNFNGATKINLSDLWLTN